jgi:lipid-binding SYLF domain-containing protein
MNNTRRYFTLAGATAVLAAAIGSPPARADASSDATALVQKAQAVIGAFSAHNDFPTLRPALARARGVLIFPSIVKAGFVLGGSGGSGVLLVHDMATGDWVGPAFYTMGSASLGLQAGVSAAEVVMVVQSQKALDSLYTNKLKLGGDVSVAVGPKGAGAGASLTSDFVVYSTVKGAFAGLSLEGSVLDVRQTLNEAYYGRPVPPIDILVKRAVFNPAADGLRAAVKSGATK